MKIRVIGKKICYGCLEATRKVIYVKQEKRGSKDTSLRDPDWPTRKLFADAIFRSYELRSIFQKALDQLQCLCRKLETFL